VSPRELYDHDFFEWTRCNAALLRAGRLSEADLEHIAEEIEDMGKRDYRELLNRLEVLLGHLLKWKYQPERRTPSWQNTIDTQRTRILNLLDQMPSLRPAVESNLAKAYPRAVRRACRETGIPPNQWPAECPFSSAEVLDEGFFPE